MQYDNRVIGRIIRKIRQQKGLTQDVVSGLAGISRSHLAMIENGQVSPTVDTLWKIAGALDRKLSELIRIVETETVTSDL